MGAPETRADNFGGHMQVSQCYNGAEYTPNVICATRNLQGEIVRDEGGETRKYILKAHLTASYMSEKGHREAGSRSVGHRVEVVADFEVEDTKNYFNPEPQLPILVRFILRDRSTFIVRSLPLTLMRIPGQRKLKGTIVVVLYNSIGAKSVEILDKIEVLFPGVSGMLVLEGISPR